MRSKHLEVIISFILSVISYSFILPVFYIARNFLGVESDVIYTFFQIIIFILVYGIISHLVKFVMGEVNKRILFIRKKHGGRDILEEERFESESGFISLNPKN